IARFFYCWLIYSALLTTIILPFTKAPSTVCFLGSKRTTPKPFSLRYGLIFPSYHYYFYFLDGLLRRFLLPEKSKNVLCEPCVLGAFMSRPVLALFCW